MGGGIAAHPPILLMGFAVTKFPRWARVVLVGAAIAAGVLFAKDLLLKIVLEQVASQMIGARMDVGGLGLGIVSHKVRLTNIRLHNPPGFPQEAFVSMPQVMVDVDLPALLKGRLHFPLIVFQMDKLIVIKNGEGKLNVDELKIVQEKMKEKTNGPAPNFRIDTLKLNIEQVIYVDEQAKGGPITQAFDVHLKNKTLHNIEGVPQLVAAVMVEALKPTAIRSAGLLAASALLGVGFLPGLAFGVIVADDDSGADTAHSAARVYGEALKLVKELGTLKRENKAGGQIFGKVYGCDVVVEVEDKGWGKSHVKIKARKYLLAKGQIAAGLLYQLMERLK